eukprot:9491251-Pyramimonas_sp.AAC.1
MREGPPPENARAGRAPPADGRPGAQGHNISDRGNRAVETHQGRETGGSIESPLNPPEARKPPWGCFP